MYSAILKIEMCFFDIKQMRKINYFSEVLNSSTVKPN